MARDALATHVPCANAHAPLHMHRCAATAVPPEADYLGATVASPGWALDNAPLPGARRWCQDSLLVMRRGTWGHGIYKVGDRASLAGSARRSPCGARL